MAKLLDLTPGFVGLIERGFRGTNAYVLAKLSKIFNIPIDQIFYRTSNETVTESESLHHKLNSFLSDFSDEELHVVIDLVKGIHSITRSSCSKNEDMNTQE